MRAPKFEIGQYQTSERSAVLLSHYLDSVCREQQTTMFESDTTSANLSTGKIYPPDFIAAKV